MTLSEALPEHRPDYDGLLRAFHASHGPLLRRIVESLPVGDDGVAVDLACGDGFYCQLLASQLGSAGTLLGVDVAPAYVRSARRRTARTPASRVLVLFADAYQLPLADACADLVWCAQSMVTLDDPRAVLHEMCRVLKPGGTAAVLENNQLHHVLLPWPRELELQIEQARVQAHRQRYGSGNLDFARASLECFAAAGLTPAGRVTYASDFVAPVEDAVLSFLEQYFRSVWEDICDHLAPAAKQQLWELISPDSPRYMPRQSAFEMTTLNVVSTAHRL